LSKDAKYRDDLKQLQDVALFNANLTTELGDANKQLKDEINQLKEDFGFLTRKVDMFLRPETPKHGVPSGE
jgi:hypothetical protein